MLTPPHKKAVTCTPHSHLPFHHPVWHFPNSLLTLLLLLLMWHLLKFLSLSQQGQTQIQVIANQPRKSQNWLSCHSRVRFRGLHQPRKSTNPPQVDIMQDMQEAKLWEDDHWPVFLKWYILLFLHLLHPSLFQKNILWTNLESQVDNIVSIRVHFKSGKGSTF